MSGYISRGFAAIVMNLPRPLKGLPALNDLEPKRRVSVATSRSYTMDGYAVHPFIYILLVCHHSRNLSVFIFNAHIWQERCSDIH